MVRFFNTFLRLVCTLLIFSSVTVANAAPIRAQTASNMTDGPNLTIPKMDSHDAAAMDAHLEMKGVNPFDFAARMPPANPIIPTKGNGME